MPKLDHFSFLAPFYDKVLPPRQSDKLIEIVDLPTSGLLLDAGGGTGRISIGLRDYAKNIVVGDLSVPMLKQTKGKNGIIPVGTHAEILPFPDELFDRVIMIDAFHHVCNQEESARELWRVLKPGGRLVIEEPDVRKFSVKLIAIAEKLALMRSNFMNPERIQNLFNFSNQTTQIMLDGFNAWVIVEKLKDKSLVQ